MSLSVPTWIAAIATVVLAVGVVVAAIVARKALSAHVRQLAAQHELTKQLAEAMELQSQNLRMALEERRRAQACQVFIELKRLGSGELAAQELGSRRRSGGRGRRLAGRGHGAQQQPAAHLRPLRDLAARHDQDGQAGPGARLLPGQQVCFERASEPDGDGSAVADAEAPTAFLTFRDAAGLRWTVREDGTLSDISPAPEARAHD